MFQPKGRNRLRTRRIHVHDLKLGEVVARAKHAGLGSIEATIENLSLHGMALVVAGAASKSSLVLGGDRLEQLTVECAGGVLYEGAALVRRVAEKGDTLVLGVELPSRGIDLGELYRRGARYSFAERLHAVDRAAHHEHISVEFKAWVADLRAYLEATQQFLSNEERALDDHDLLTREQMLREYLDEVAPQVISRMNAASSQLPSLVSHLSDEQHASYRVFFRAQILPLLMQSPMLRRSYEKPLGYAGDYELMNMLYRDHAEGPTLFAKALNMYAAQEGAARANINRLPYLAAKMREILRQTRESRLTAASIGCGPARELSLLLSSSPELGRQLDVALIDQEERSITFCERTLGPLAAQTDARFQFIRESIRRLLMARQLSATLGQRQLIYSAGLFDYLNQRSFVALLASLYEALEPGGQLVVGNVAADNPSRWMLEYYLDWFLIHRSRSDLTALASGLTPKPASVEVDAEPLGINLFLLIRK
jgi:extracellular factor (EF) 3-hydroxypalmitic acid methyl ester biosynthesis protein